MKVYRGVKRGTWQKIFDYLVFTFALVLGIYVFYISSMAILDRNWIWLIGLVIELLVLATMYYSYYEILSIPNINFEIKKKAVDLHYENGSKRTVKTESINSIELLDVGIGISMRHRYIVFNHDKQREVFLFERGYSHQKFNPQKIMDWLKSNGLKERNPDKIHLFGHRMFEK